MKAATDKPLQVVETEKESLHRANDLYATLTAGKSQPMAHFLSLGFEIAGVFGLGRGFDGDLLGDF